MPLLLALQFLACSPEPTVSGMVVGPSGAAIADAAVTIPGTKLSGVSDGTGHYSVVGVPGAVKLVFLKPGFLDEERSVPGAVVVDDVMMIPVPSMPGLVFVDASGAQTTLEPTTLHLTTERPCSCPLNRTKVSAVHAAAPLAHLPAGRGAFVDSDPAWIRLFRTRESDGAIHDSMACEGGEGELLFDGFIEDRTSPTREWDGPKSTLAVRWPELAPGQYVYAEATDSGALAEGARAYPFVVDAPAGAE